MKRNDEIIQLSNEIMLDITEGRMPLYTVLLKASRLSLLLDLPKNVDLFKEWAKYAEQNQFVVDTFRSSMESAKDPDVSIASANPSEFVNGGFGSRQNGNTIERNYLRSEATKVVGYLAKYRTETYTFVSGVNSSWQFGNVAETIFDKKRKRVEPVLERIFPDTSQRLNSIEQNLRSTNPEDWKNAVSSCRALLMDIADIVNPAKDKDDKGKYINRLKDYVSPKVQSGTKKKLLKTYFDELKARIEYTMDLTQGSAHQSRPLLTEAEDVVLNTYLVIAELMQLYSEHNNDELRQRLTELQAKKPDVVGPNTEEVTSKLVIMEKDKNDSINSAKRQ